MNWKRLGEAVDFQIFHPNVINQPPIFQQHSIFIVDSIKGQLNDGIEYVVGF